ncbi:ATP-dependent protease La [Kwoniella pini CBS 10737]|uniref:Lon protease homolog n=1 Tax=Kwoniella pini CBS 10737 TaxID=1296096 RepID=A0A1B9HYD9_9TREE|nr:ATP-dependent protease La [Kwoniella pini CBS 10737]OCF48295.1 ATP-dependent protease La [Kwoniella pini CBS 10737]
MTTPLLPSSLPLIPLRSPQVLFPHLRASIPLSSTQLSLVIDAVQSNLGGKGGNGERGMIGIVPVADHDRRVGRWGCAARIKSIQKSSDEDDLYILLVEGLTRIRLPRSLPPVLSILPSIPIPTSPYSLAIPATIPSSTDLLPLALKLLPEQLHSRINALPASLLADILVTILGVDWDSKVELLGIPDIEQRCDRVREILLDLMSSKGIQPPEGINNEKPSKSNALIVRSRVPLGLTSSNSKSNTSSNTNPLDKLPEDLQPLFKLYQKRLSELSKTAIETLDRELKRLSKIPPQSAEYGVAKTYIEWILALPFKKVSENYEIDLKNARDKLDADHEGLDKIKKRVIEYLAVYRLKRQLFVESQEKRKLQNSSNLSNEQSQSTEKLDKEVENDLLELIPSSERQSISIPNIPQNDKNIIENDDEPSTDVYRDKGPILLLVGPPGVGKTSIAKSLANSLGRKFHRISLGGVRDEAEIRGHRRTYVGALPGLLVQAMRKVGVSNPLILLDELDKVEHGGFHGDPSAALLEALDPAQNWNFHDHYMGDVPIDLSQVLFIATANQLDSISWPLLDRCEVIECSGYITPEKLSIAKKFLLPKQIKECGLNDTQIKMNEEVLEKVIIDYTREAGVRNLERQIGKLCRSKAVEFSISREPVSPQDKQAYQPNVVMEDVERILGISHYGRERPETNVRPGVINGLSYNGSGNGGLLIIETLLIPGGSGKLVTTGRLGEVFRESIELCFTWVKSRSLSLGITTSPSENPLKGYDVHYHIPEGAIPKDGPSAGIATVLAFVSLLTGRPIDVEIAVTGEMSLRGSCLRIGGVKEKVIGAHRAGVKKIVLPRTNRPDVMTDVPELVRNDIQFIYVDKIEQAIEEVWGKDIWAGGDKDFIKVDARL